MILLLYEPYRVDLATCGTYISVGLIIIEFLNVIFAQNVFLSFQTARKAFVHRALAAHVYVNVGYCSTTNPKPEANFTPDQ